MRRFVPQFVARWVCGRRGHQQMRYSAQVAGQSMVVETCMCGDKQDARLYSKAQFPKKR